MKALASIFCVLLANLFTVTLAMGQAPSSSLNLPSMTPPSPNAISLGKYGDIPVGLYTGIPNINIPLYNIKVGNFSLPISLSYHSQGLKVEENAGWVGLGWSLNAGGMVTRTLHGLPDDGAGGYWNYSSWTTDTVAALGANTNAFFGGVYDVQPDLFYFNFGSHSGKFVMDGTSSHTAHFIPFQNYKVSYQFNSTLSNQITQFQIVDDEGITYVFGAFETTTDETSTTFNPYNSAWYITKIIAPAGTITFNYATDATFSYQASEIDYLNTDGGNLDNQFNPGHGGSARYLANNSVILSSISFPTGSITFSQAGSRKDIPTAAAITGFTVADVNGTLQHKFIFSESYFGDTTATQPLISRLKLDSVTEVSVTDSTQTKKYKFAYFNPSQVPAVQSKAQDYWGFYNGQIRNTSLLPALDPTIYGTYIAGQQGSIHGDRTPSASAAQTGVLTSIGYPTGGTSTFIYEGNDYGTIAGIQQAHRQIYQETAGAGATETSTVNLTNDTTLFTLDSSQTVTLNFTGQYATTPDGDGPTVLIQKLPAGTTIYSSYGVGDRATAYPNLTAGNYRLINYVDGTNQTISTTLFYFYVDTTVTQKSFPTGGIRIRQIINTDPVSGQTNTKTYHYTSTADPTMSSGNLISSPVYYELQKSYTYPTTWAMVSSTSLNYMGFTQGSHIGYATVTETDSGSQNIGKKVSYFNATDYSNPPGSVYYTNVPGVVNSVPSPGSTPYKYQTDYDVFRGMPVKEVTYNAQGNIVKQSWINYNTSTGFTTESPNFFKVDAIAGWTYWMCHYGCNECFCPHNDDWESMCFACGNYALSNYTAAKYSIISPWIYKTSTIDTVYDVNGNNPIGTATYYYYDNPSHGLVTRVITVDSKGDSLKMVNKYAGDQAQISGLSSNATTALDSLISMNKIAAPIEVDHYNSASLLSTLRTDYNVWHTSPLIVEPQHVWYSILLNPLEDRVDYYQYDTANNPLEASKNRDIHHSYIWDHQHQFLIAEVANAQQSDVAYTSFEADGTGGWTTAGTTPTAGGITGSHYYSLSSNISRSGLTASTKYIVSYWSTAGAYSITGTATGYPITGKTVTIGGVAWTYYEHLVTGQTSVQLNGSGGIDELRLYPSTAQMTTYTYSPNIGITSQCDVANRITYYSYDGLARLSFVKDQDGNIIKTYQYHYKGQ